jgi:glycosyltransferase involved in cell wall biosynthesis
MIRISSSIPPLRSKPTSSVLHNVLDQAFDKIVEDLPSDQGCGLVSIGSAHSYRAFPSLIKAYEQYRRRGGRYDLTIVAGRGTESEIRTIGDSAQGVPGLRVLRGDMDRKDAIALMAASEGVIFPSLVEASPISVLEAMALGLPIAHSDISAHRELCMGYPSLHFTAENTSEMARALGALEHAGRISSHPLQSRQRRSQFRNAWIEEVHRFLEAIP